MTSPLSFDEGAALIASGIGSEIARLFAAAGLPVALTYHHNAIECPYEDP